MRPLRLLLPLLCAALRPSAAYRAAGVTMSMSSRGGGAEDADLAPRYHLNNGAHFQNDPSRQLRRAKMDEAHVRLAAGRAERVLRLYKSCTKVTMKAAARRRTQ